MITTKCIICSKDFKVFPSRSNSKYCSRKCYYSNIGYWTGKKRPPFSEEWKNNMSKGHEGIKNFNWKGGKSYDGKGYVRIKNPSHPFADKNGYVFEHRYKMELHLKRPLTPKEIVHHINTIRDDNRIENLQLFPNRYQHMLLHKNINNQKTTHV